ncbi:MAG: Hpt domain-containing protein, partial [Synergistaceae bacterium]|nr:Hpt domain-containing protein [Synergistaceae bacterium]
KGAYNTSGVRRVVAYYFCMTVLFTVVPLIISVIIVPGVLMLINYLSAVIFTAAARAIVNYERDIPSVEEVELPSGDGEALPEELYGQLNDTLVYNAMLIILLIILFIVRKPIIRIIKDSIGFFRTKVKMRGHAHNKVINEEIITELPKEKIKSVAENPQNINVNRLEQNQNVDFEIDGLDINTGIIFSGGTVELFLRTLTVFSEDAAERISQIRESLEINDLSLYTTYVHALKSALATIGAKDLSESAKSLEYAGKNEDMAFIEGNNDKFLKEFEILLNNIKNAILHDSLAEKYRTDENLSSAIIKEKLINLKEALENMDVMTADGIMNDLSAKSPDGKIKDALEQIAHDILLCDYDNAVNSINVLIEEGGKS